MPAPLQRSVPVTASSKSSKTHKFFNVVRYPPPPNPEHPKTIHLFENISTPLSSKSGPVKILNNHSFFGVFWHPSPRNHKRQKTFSFSMVFAPLQPEVSTSQKHKNKVFQCFFPPFSSQSQAVKSHPINVAQVFAILHLAINSSQYQSQAANPISFIMSSTPFSSKSVPESITS